MSWRWGSGGAALAMGCKWGCRWSNGGYKWSWRLGGAAVGSGGGKLQEGADVDRGSVQGSAERKQ